MDQFDWYYKQPVTPAEMTAAFEAAERSINSLAVAMGVKGIALRGGVVERAPNTPTGAVVLGPMLAYDDSGNRIYMPNATLDVDLAIDENSVATAVTTPGAERYLSIFVRFAREFSDARKDGNDEDVFYARLESYRVAVAAGAEAPAGAASRPGLRPGHVLLADVRLTYGQSLVTAASILSDRSEFLFRSQVDGEVIEGRNLQEVAQRLLERLVEFQSQIVNTAGAISFTPPGGMTATNVQAALEELRAMAVAAGAAQTAAQVAFTPAGTLTSNNVQAGLAEAGQKAADALAAAGGIGGALLAANNTWTGSNRYQGALAAQSPIHLSGGTNEILYTDVNGTPVRRERDIALPLSSAIIPLYDAGGGDWRPAWRYSHAEKALVTVLDATTAEAADANALFFDFRLPLGASLVRVSVGVRVQSVVIPATLTAYASMRIPRTDGGVDTLSEFNTPSRTTSGELDEVNPLTWVQSEGTAFYLRVRCVGIIGMVSWARVRVGYPGPGS